jgi:hypothetical protein
MLDILKDIILMLILAGVCAIGAWLLRTASSRFLQPLGADPESGTGDHRQRPWRGEESVGYRPA